MYNISFSGETLPGCHPDAARSRLANYFHLDADTDIERFFSGEVIILKRLLDRNTAVSTYQDLRRLGIIVKIEKLDPEEAAEEQRKQEQQREAARQKQAELERQAALRQKVQQAREQAEREAAQERAQKAREKREAKMRKPDKQPAKSAPAPAKKKKVTKPAAEKKQTARVPAEKKQSAEPTAKQQPEPASSHKDEIREQKLAKARAARQKAVQQQTTRKTPAQEASNAQQPAEAPAAARPAPRAPTPAPRTDGERRRRKRQPGAPNLFDVRLSEGALNEARKSDQHFSGAPTLGAAILLVAFVLVGLRFWIGSFDTPASGLGSVAVDGSGRPAVVVNDQLLRHDRAGNPGELKNLSTIGLSPATPIAFLANGDLLQLRPPQGQDLPAWLRDLVGVELQPGRLLRCSTREEACEPFLQPLDEATFAVNRDSGYVLVADVPTNRLMKYDLDGNALASHPIALTGPVHLGLRDGVLYLAQGNSDVLKALRTENRAFGEELGLYTLAVNEAQATGHIFPGALAWLGDAWWVVMQSRDNSTAGLYRFDANWQPLGAVPLPASARPDQPVSWGEKLLVPDASQGLVYRIAADNTLERPFSEDPIGEALAARSAELEQSASLQAVVMLVLFFAALGLFTYGAVKSLQGKIYQALNDTNEKAFDIENDAIDWLEPGRDARALLRRAGFGLAGLTFLLLAMAVLLKPGLGITVAALVVLAGIGGYGYAIYQSWGCHLGRLGDQLVVVDHKSTYRVGRGPRIQYVNNYVMIEDVIVYLGNPLLPQFAHEALQQEFEPIVTRGIKVDRTTLRLKLINSRHPMFYGSAGLVFSLCAALIILLLA